MASQNFSFVLLASSRETVPLVKKHWVTTVPYLKAKEVCGEIRTVEVW